MKAIFRSINAAFHPMAQTKQFSKWLLLLHLRVWGINTVRVIVYAVNQSTTANNSFSLVANELSYNFTLRNQFP
ncbi:MAG TPA: hypothetical protein VGQ09_15260 [Chitinophagaceae bacterium]|jgi:hypothetical protein|nr:hypothetical protein [Chitinophagaceae bacterium]